MTRQELQYQLKQLRIEGYVTEGFSLRAATWALAEEYHEATARKVAHYEHLRKITKECKDNYEARQQVVTEEVVEDIPVEVLEDTTDYGIPVREFVNTGTDTLTKVANYTYMLVTHENTIRISKATQRILTFIDGCIFAGIGYALAPATRRAIDTKLTEVLLMFCDLVDALERPVEALGKMYYQLTHRAISALYWAIVPDVGQPDTSFLSPPRS